MGLSVYGTASILALSFMALMLYLALFERSLDYRIEPPPDEPLESERFLRMLGALANGEVHRETGVEVLTNGEAYYEAELQAIAEARHSVNLEAYIFHPGELTKRFLSGLLERAQHGVAVRIVLDSVGSFVTGASYFRDLAAAGGQVAFYHPIRW